MEALAVFGVVAIFLLYLLLVIVGLILFLIPTIIAIKTDHPHKLFIVLINILGSFFIGLGWIVALIWCLITPKESRPYQGNSAIELQRLSELKDKGILTDKEFEDEKKRILGSN